MAPLVIRRENHQETQATGDNTFTLAQENSQPHTRNNTKDTNNTKIEKQSNFIEENIELVVPNDTEESIQNSIEFQ